MNIEFNNRKRDKEIKNIKEWNKSLKSNYYHNTQNAYILFSETIPYDYIYFYGRCVTDFEIIANSYLVDNLPNKVINNVYLSANAFFMFKKKVEEHENTEFANVENKLLEYEYSVCKLIAIDQLSLFVDKCQDSITANLFLGNEKLAKKHIDMIPDNSKETKSIYYNQPIYLKDIYNAIIERDSVKFHDLIIRRIKKYRRNMVDYSIIIE